MSISIDVDISAFTKGMDDLAQRQIPFALTKALNATALDVQVRERARLREVFTLRREDWADRSIKLTHFAKKAEPYATLAIAPPGKNGSLKADIFGKFEDQTTKTPFGSHGIAVPVNARRNKADLVVEKIKPKALHLHREGNRIVGDQGTYIVTLRDGRQLLLQRKDLGKRAAKKAGRGTAEEATVLFLFVPVAHLNPNLQFEANARTVVDRVWAQRFEEAFAAAMATAR